MTQKDTTLETLLNGRLAELLRRQGLEAEAEQVLQDRDHRRHRVDVLVELEEQAVAIEAEFAPARTVIADAEKRLPKHPLLWRGLPVSCAFTLVYPKSLQGMPESRARTELETCNDLRFSQLLPKELGTQYHLFADLHSTATSIGTTGGTVRTLADCLHSFWLRAETSSLIEDSVREASSAIARASECLKNAGEVHPHAGEDSDAAATSALIWLNALLFQELLAQNLAPESLPEEHRNKRIRPPDPEADPDTLRSQWKEILDINWWPIFHYATEALRSVPSRPAALALSELQPVARTIAKRGVIRRHDIAGRIFHRLLKTRKFLATNYTTIPAAILLAKLAFDREAEPWKKIVWESGHLHIARELRHAPQRLAAVVTKEAMLGVRSWITAIPKERIAGGEEALCLWLNSTPGLMLRLGHANRPYLGRSAVPHELLYTFPVLAVEQLSKEQRRAARELFSDLKGRPLQGFAQLAEDPVLCQNSALLKWTTNQQLRRPWNPRRIEGISRRRAGFRPLGCGWRATGPPLVRTAGSNRLRGELRAADFAPGSPSLDWTLSSTRANVR